MLKEQLYLGDTLRRMQTTRSIRDDLSIARIAMQYFLQKGSQGSRQSSIAHRELHAPPTDTATIRNRQNLVTILMRHSALSELESEVISLRESERGLDARNMDKLPFLMHRAVMYNEALERLTLILPREAAFSSVHDNITRAVEQTTLRRTIEEWKVITGRGIDAVIDLEAGVIRYVFPGNTQQETMRELRVSDVSARLNAPYLERLDAMLPVLDPFMKELEEALGFYVALAKYGRALQEQGIPMVMPEITDAPGYLDAKRVYHPFLGLPTVSFSSAERGGKHPDFPPDTYPHDYGRTSERIHLVLGRNKGAKSTWVSGRGVLQLQAQIGSPVPAECCKIGPIRTMGSVFIKSVDIGAGQSTFSQALDEFGRVLDVAGQDGLVLLDDATEGTDTDNSRAYMNFVLTKLKERRAIAYLATQDRRLLTDPSCPPATFYTTVPNTYAIARLIDGEQPEPNDWRRVAAETGLAKHMR